MAYWLFKSEPSAWSWDDLGFFYHSQSEKAVVGIVKVCAESHPDSTADDDRWDCVDIKAVKSVKTPVTLQMCKDDPHLAEMALVKTSRLSVQPVTEAEWQIVCEMAGFDAKAGVTE
jgi:predicted RNA-binding protein with PUA-like domain